MVILKNFFRSQLISLENNITPEIAPKMKMDKISSLRLLTDSNNNSYFLNSLF